MEKISMSLEDYLEAILMLGGTTSDPIRSVEVANSLEVSKASVNKAIGLLKSRGLVDQPYYGDITLTAEGYKYAKAIYKRHRYLTAFLNKALGIPKQRAEEEACLMEHAISDASFKKWVAYIDDLGIVEEE